MTYPLHLIKTRTMLLRMRALLASQAQPPDDRLKMPLADALAIPAAQEKLDPNIKLFFGDAKHPAAK